MFNAENYLTYSKAEDWHVLKVVERVSRQDLINAGNQYLDLFTDKFVQAPWGILDGVLYIVNRSYVVDEEMGVANIFCRLGNSTGMPDSHTFRLVNGRYRWVHAL